MSLPEEAPQTWTLTVANLSEVADRLGVDVLGAPGSPHGALLHAGGRDVHAYVGDRVTRHVDGTITVHCRPTGHAEDVPEEGSDASSPEYSLGIHFTVPNGTLPLETVTALSDALSAHLPIGVEVSYMALVRIADTDEDEPEEETAVQVGQRLQVQAGSTSIDGTVTEVLPAKGRKPLRVTVQGELLYGLWSTGTGNHPVGWVMTETGAILTGTMADMESVVAPGTYTRPVPVSAGLRDLRYNAIRLMASAMAGKRPAPTNLITR